MRKAIHDHIDTEKQSIELSHKTQEFSLPIMFRLTEQQEKKLQNFKD